MLSAIIATHWPAGHRQAGLVGSLNSCGRLQRSGDALTIAMFGNWLMRSAICSRSARPAGSAVVGDWTRT